MKSAEQDKGLVMIELAIYEEYRKILNYYVPNNLATKMYKEKKKKKKQDFNINNTVRLGDSDKPFSELDSLANQK